MHVLCLILIKKGKKDNDNDKYKYKYKYNGEESRWEIKIQIPGYWGCAAGKAKSAAKTELEKIKMTEMTCAELIKEAAKIIYQVGVLVLVQG